MNITKPGMEKATACHEVLIARTSFNQMLRTVLSDLCFAPDRKYLTRAEFFLGSGCPFFFITVKLTWVYTNHFEQSYPRALDNDTWLYNQISTFWHLWC